MPLYAVTCISDRVRMGVPYIRVVMAFHASLRITRFLMLLKIRACGSSQARSTHATTHPFRLNPECM